VLNRFDLIASGFIEPDSGFAGIIDFEGALSSDGRRMQSQGRAKADRMQIIKTGSPTSKPIFLDYTATYDLQLKPEISASKGRIRQSSRAPQRNFDSTGNRPL